MQHAQDAVNSCQADISIFCTFSCYSLSRTSASLLVTSCNRRRPQSHSHAENMARSRPRAAGFFDFFLVVETVPATSTGTALACNEVTNSKTRLPKMFEVAPPAGTLEPWRMSTSKKFPDSGRLASANPEVVPQGTATTSNLGAQFYRSGSLWCFSFQAFKDNVGLPRLRLDPFPRSFKSCRCCSRKTVVGTWS